MGPLGELPAAEVGEAGAGRPDELSLGIAQGLVPLDGVGEVPPCG